MFRRFFRPCHLPLLMLGLAFLAGPAARAQDKILDEGIAKLSAAIADWVAKEGADRAVLVGDFVAPPNLQAGGGPGISSRLTRSLAEAHKIASRPDAPVQVIGKFTMVEDRQPGDRFDSVGMRIEAELLDPKGEKLQAVAIKVFGDSVVQFAGGNGVLPAAPEGQTSPDREAAKADAVIRPTGAVEGAEIRAATDSPFGIEVRVRRGTTRDSDPRLPELVDGRPFVKLAEGQEYIVRLSNHSGAEAAVALSIDGLSMWAFSADGRIDRHIILPPGGSADIPGWFIDDDTSEAFEVGTYGKSAAKLKLVPVSAVGVITAAFSESIEGGDKGGEDATLATVRGRQIDQKFVTVKRVIKPVQAVVSVRYRRD